MVTSAAWSPRVGEVPTGTANVGSTGRASGVGVATAVTASAGARCPRPLKEIAGAGADAAGEATALTAGTGRLHAPPTTTNANIRQYRNPASYGPTHWPSSSFNSFRLQYCRRRFAQSEF